ncbi:MAG: ATP-dependent 6-phosphofructokinase [Porphyromonas sp.]|nr:ATP-dependent 6-phosphofructokinase [Porphyromonas sp.]
MKAKRIGILSSGGDAPGINATIRAVAKTAIHAHGIEVLGFKGGFTGITNRDYVELNMMNLSNLLSMGGTILGSSRDKAFRKALLKDEEAVKDLQKAWDEMELDALVCIGGNGTQKTAAVVSELGFNVIGIPKTIDNDVYGTDITFGFDTAVGVATELIDRIHSTAQSHNRVIVVEVMGHEAGWIALHSGMASGADVILLPELGCDLDIVVDAIKKRYEEGKNYAIIVVAEGVVFEEQEDEEPEERESAGRYLSRKLREEAGIDSRETVLGYVQRGGAPSSFDRNLCTKLGGHASQLIADGIFGVMVSMRANKVTHVPLSTVKDKLKLVEPTNSLITEGRRMDVCFGVDFDELRLTLEK